MICDRVCLTIDIDDALRNFDYVVNISPSHDDLIGSISQVNRKRCETCGRDRQLRRQSCSQAG
jgi:hypothetical protein